MLELPDPPYPDAVIGMGACRAHVEFVGYREQTADNERFRRDDEFLRDLGMRKLGDADLSSVGIGIKYTRDGRGRAVIPPRADEDAAFGGIKRGYELIRREVDLRPEQTAYLHFSMRGAVGGVSAIHAHGESPALELSDSEMARWCTRLRFTMGRSDTPHATVLSDLNPQAIGLSDSTLWEAAASKHEKLALGNYKTESGYSFWLVVHADGYPASTRVPEEHTHRVTKILHAVDQEAGTQFDRIYWMTNCWGREPEGDVRLVSDREPSESCWRAGKQLLD